ncbi:peptidyl-prolyl cis-trans isomerase FKBP7-like isoform X2 [Amphiura filiformis]|uniref:peptidyl-prolyl cis-trans isomerase FKBP7-like isoform X2 n=1 Tax=Amphiura filiformis TaxID=82378 RepID=UPI003B21A4CD
MKLFTACGLLFITTVLLFSVARCDEEDPKVAVAEDGTCDKESCGDDAPPKVEAEETDAEEEIIAEEDDPNVGKDGEIKEMESHDPADDLPVTTCICTGVEEKPEVGVEVLFKPEACGRRSPVNNDDVVTIHLRGYKASDMSEFMTTYNEDGSEGESVFWPMGVGSSIKGLEMGLLDMCVGEKRKITVPAKMIRNGRNEFAGDKIPRGETLIFEVEMIGAYPHYQSGMPNMFKRMNKNENEFVEWQEAHDYMVLEGAFPDGPDSVIPRLTTEWIAKVDKDEDGS